MKNVKMQFCSLLIFMNIISHSGFGIETKDTLKLNKELFIGINFSPDYCFRTLTNGLGPFGDSIIKFRNNYEIPKFGYTFGLNLSYKINNHFYFETGLQYSNKGYQTKLYHVDWVTQQPERLPDKMQFFYNDIYLDIPAIVNYVLINKRFQWLIGFGITANLFIRETQNTTYEYLDGTIDKFFQVNQSPFGSIALSAVVSTGLSYKINEKMKIQMEPTFRYGLPGMTTSPISASLWSAGLNISYFYKIR